MTAFRGMKFDQPALQLILDVRQGGNFMRVPSFVYWILALSATAAGLAVFAWAQPPTPAKPPADAKPISVAPFSEQLPGGDLWGPLGTGVRVTGGAFDGNTTTAT